VAYSHRAGAATRETGGTQMEWMIMPYRRYADFSGRSGRREYWMFFLFYMIVCVVVGGPAIGALMIATAMHRGLDSPLLWVGLAVLTLFAVISFIPYIAVHVRRFHDQDKSGWLLLLSFVPYVGSLIVLIFMMLEGTRGPNRFGPDPRDPYSVDVFG